jgi:hypothetical protein
MAYNSAALTLAYQVAGPIGKKHFIYDTVDVTTDVDTAGYFSNGKEVGMEKGDTIEVRIWTTAIPAATSEKQTAANVANILTAMGTMVVLGISTAGAADVTNVTAWTVTNSD